MTFVLQTAVGLAIPFVGTALGAAAVFLFKSNIPPRVQKILLGFASGVMLAASVWSLLLPTLALSDIYGVTMRWYAAGCMVRYIRPAGVWICTPGSLRT